MKARCWSILSWVIILSLALASCSVFAPSPDGLSDADRQQTAVMETIQARLTEQVIETVVAQATQAAQSTQPPPATATATTTPESVVLPPTAGPTQTSVIPTRTPVVPTRTPTSVPTVPASTIAPPAERMEFVKDVTIPDGTVLTSGSKFTKTWRIKNTGTSTWTTSYQLVFYSGNAMGGKAAYNLPASVKPGEMLDLSIELTAPATAGSFKGLWYLRNPSGVNFGYGSNGNEALVVSIQVTAYSSETVPASIYPYDFTASLCSARWLHSFDKISLPCTGYDTLQQTWAAVTSKPKFETGREDDERTIWIHLEAEKEGWLQGVFTPYRVQTNDHFTGWIGCMYNSKNCDVVFSLDYQIGNNKPVNIKKWEEKYDEKIVKVDIDLSFLAGQDVKFLLGVTNKGGSAVDAFWFVPAIRNFPPPPTATPTVTSSHTATATITTSPTAKPTATATLTPSATVTPSSTPSPTVTPTWTPTQTPTALPTETHEGS